MEDASVQAAASRQKRNVLREDHASAGRPCADTKIPAGPNRSDHSTKAARCVRAYNQGQAQHRYGNPAALAPFLDAQFGQALAQAVRVFPLRGSFFREMHARATSVHGNTAREEQALDPSLPLVECTQEAARALNVHVMELKSLLTIPGNPMRKARKMDKRCCTPREEVVGRCSQEIEMALEDLPTRLREGTHNVPAQEASSTRDDGKAGRVERDSPSCPWRTRPLTMQS
jgi:hypothetical protein